MKVNSGVSIFAYLQLVVMCVIAMLWIKPANAKSNATSEVQSLQFICDGANFTLHLDSKVGIAKADLSLEPGMWVEIPQQAEKDYAAFYNLDSSKLLKFGKHAGWYYVATYKTPDALNKDKAELRLRCRL